MRTRKLNILLTISSIAVLALSLSSCHKEKPIRNGYRINENAPLIVGGGVSTKTFFGSTNFNDAENRAKVFDFVTPTGQVESAVAFIDDELYANKAGNATEGTSGNWSWSLSGSTYFWTDSGSHRFMSYLTYDAGLDLTTQAFFGSDPALDASRKVLSIPAKTINATTPQFDFIYSNEVVRSMDEEVKDYSSVPFVYHHLFTTFSIGIRNWTDTPITIKSFRLINMPDTKTGVTVTYNTTPFGGSVSNAMSINGTSGNAGNIFFEKDDYDITLNETQGIADLFNPSNASTTNYIMWPLRAEEIYDALQTIDENGLVEASANAPQMVITYTLSGNDITRTIPFPNVEWLAGKRYHFELQFIQKEIRLNYNVLPWNYEEMSLTYGKDAIQGEEIIYDPLTCIVDEENKTVTYSGHNINAVFRITLPKNAAWIVGMDGDVDYFRIRFISNSTYFLSGALGESATNPLVNTLTGPIRPDLEGGAVWIEIVPLTTLNRHEDHKIELNFKVRTSSGRIIDANSELNTTPYTIILPRQ